MTAPSIEAPQPVPAARPRTWPRRLRGFCYWTLVLTLAGINAWWLIRDARPLAELKTISDWAREKRYGEAEVALREHLRRSPHNAEALVMLARLRADQGDTLGAARLVHNVPEWWPAKPEMLALEGRLFLESQRARDAEAAWTRCLDEGPGGHSTAHTRPRARAALDLIKLYLDQGRKDEARALVWHVYEKPDASDREDILRVRMETELLHEPPQVRAERLQRYADADPADWQSRRALALEDQALGHPEAALALMDECLRARPDDPLVRRDLLSLLHEQGNHARFLEEIARLPAAADRDAVIWKFRGLAREQARDPAGALAAYRRTIELGGGDTESYYHLGLVERQLGRPKEAAADIARSRRVYDASLKLYPAFWDYLQANKLEDGRAAARTKAIARLAELCRDLGWDREAKAWTDLLPPA